MKTTIQYPISNGLPSSDLPISQELANQLFTSEQIAAGERRFTITRGGDYGNVSAVSGLTISKSADRSKLSKYAPEHCMTECTIYGERTLSRVNQAGYEMQGYVSINGKTRRAFTSSLMFRLPDGTLICCAVLYV
jgi:hypothetical protein